MNKQAVVVLAAGAAVFAVFAARPRKANAQSNAAKPPPPPVSPPPGGGGTPTLPKPPLSPPPIRVPQVPAPTKPPTPPTLQRQLLDSLRATQSKYGAVKKAKTHEDRALVRRAQKAWGLKQDGKAGPKTLLEAASRGPSGTMPLVMYWPVGATTKNVRAYRAALVALALKAGGARGAELEASAARERGQAGVAGGLLT